jgi:thiamine kinase-like enzyme
MALVSDEELARRLDLIEAFAGVPRHVEELPGGLTNRNVKVTTPHGVYVARCTDPSSNLLGIDRDQECFNSRAAEQAGVGAQVVDYRPDLGVLLIAFLKGTALSNEDFQRPGVVAKAASAIRQLHAGPRFSGDFNMFELQPEYLKTVQGNGFRIPADYLDYADRFRSIAEVLTGTDATTVPCHNDLLAANFIEDGQVMWLIDYEYSGRATAAAQDRSRAPAGHRVEVRLDVVGLYPEWRQPSGFRLLELGDGTLRQRSRRVQQPRLHPPSRRRPGHRLITPTETDVRQHRSRPRPRRHRRRRRHRHQRRLPPDQDGDR